MTLGQNFYSGLLQNIKSFTVSKIFLAVSGMKEGGCLFPLTGAQGAQDGQRRDVRESSSPKTINPKQSRGRQRCCAIAA